MRKIIGSIMQAKTLDFNLDVAKDASAWTGGYQFGHEVTDIIIQNIYFLINVLCTSTILANFGVIFTGLYRTSNTFEN